MDFIGILVLVTGVVAVPTLCWLAWHYGYNRKEDLKSEILREAKRQEKAETKAAAARDKEARLKRLDEERLAHVQKMKVPPQAPKKTAKDASEQELLQSIRLIGKDIRLITILILICSCLTTCAAIGSCNAVNSTWVFKPIGR